MLRLAGTARRPGRQSLVSICPLFVLYFWRWAISLKFQSNNIDFFIRLRRSARFDHFVVSLFRGETTGCKPSDGFMVLVFVFELFGRLYIFRQNDKCVFFSNRLDVFFARCLWWTTISILQKVARSQWICTWRHCSLAPTSFMLCVKHRYIVSAKWAKTFLHTYVTAINAQFLYLAGYFIFTSNRLFCPKYSFIAYLQKIIQGAIFGYHKR